MTTENVINIDDARELRALGLPILPIVDAEFSDRAKRLLFRADRARDKFYRLLAGPIRPATKERHKRIRDALNNVATLHDQASRFSSDQDGEAEALQNLLTEPMGGFLAFWEATLPTLVNGGPVCITHEGWWVSITPIR